MCLWFAALALLQVEVVRDGLVLQLSSADLVPGDILLVQTGVLPCDCVLLRGECIVDENMLTGEIHVAKCEVVHRMASRKVPDHTAV